MLIESLCHVRRAGAAALGCLVTLSVLVAQQPAQPVPAPGTPPPLREARAPVRVVDETLDSRSLGRSLRYRVLLPPDYGSSARRYAALYLLHGLTGTYSDWERRSHLADHVARYDVIVVMPEGENSWYTDAATAPADKFESAVARDLIEDVEQKYRAVASRHGRAIAGLSMGGYGALKLALKNPRVFALAGSLSGALMATRELPPVTAGSPRAAFDRTVRESLAAAFGPPGSPARAANDIFALVEQATPSALPYLYLDCGTEDGLLAVNREFAAALHARKIGYEFHEVPGAHDWAYWDRQIVEFLRVMARHVPRTRRGPPAPGD